MNTNHHYKPTQLQNRWVITDQNGDVITTSGNRRTVNSWGTQETAEHMIETIDLDDVKRIPYAGAIT